MSTCFSCVGCIGLLLAVATVANGQDPPPSAPTEDWVYIENADLKAGFLRSHGGALAHLSSPGSGFNTLNHYDHGRLVQQSYYGDEDGSRWVDKSWRYNPVQGGDYQGAAARVVEFRSTPTSVYVKTIPRHWASGALLRECAMEQWAELDGPVLRVRYAFAYQGRTAHAARHQETPAVFVSPRLATLVTYTGDRPWTAAALTRKKPGWPNETASLSEGWAAYVDDTGSGIGVFVPGVSEATCYRYQGGAGSDCSYLAPVQTFALTPGLSFSYTAFFTLGEPDVIRSRFSELRGGDE